MNSWLKFALGIGGSVLLYGIVIVILSLSNKVGVNIPNKSIVMGLVILTIPFFFSRRTHYSSSYDCEVC